MLVQDNISKCLDTYRFRKCAFSFASRAIQAVHNKTLCDIEGQLLIIQAHLSSKLCKDLSGQKRQHAVATAGAQTLKQGFTAYDVERKRVEQFKYLGRILAMDNP